MRERVDLGAADEAHGDICRNVAFGAGAIEQLLHQHFVFFHKAKLRRYLPVNRPHTGVVEDDKDGRRSRPCGQRDEERKQQWAAMREEQGGPSAGRSAGRSAVDRRSIADGFPIHAPPPSRQNPLTHHSGLKSLIDFHVTP